jgi:hypothetical protein
VSKEQWHITWHDSGREPQCAPHPAYPEGIDVDTSGGAQRTCVTALPYPARRCGYYSVHCQRCDFRGLITTAGRPDDPRSVQVACLPHRNN